MILSESYRKNWIDEQVSQLQAVSAELTEKMIYAFTLLEQLQLKELKFIFKGGTSLVLMLGEFHRFSKDIDILITEKPEGLTHLFDEIVKDSPFERWEKSERADDKLQVPKEHYKFYYKSLYNTKYPDQPILLDIIYVVNTYPETNKALIQHSILKLSDPLTHVIAPTLDSLMGDKMTAFAPDTIGIPYNAKKGLEITKQLFDLALLFERMKNSEIVEKSFRRTAEMVIHYYKKDCTPDMVLQNIIQTAFILAMMGKMEGDKYTEIKKGAIGLNNYLRSGMDFSAGKIVDASAKIAYLAACFLTGSKPRIVNLKELTPEEFKGLRIEHPYYQVLNKAQKNNHSEAWLYWYYTQLLLK